MGIRTTEGKLGRAVLGVPVAPFDDAEICFPDSRLAIQD